MLTRFLKNPLILGILGALFNQALLNLYPFMSPSLDLEMPFMLSFIFYIATLLFALGLLLGYLYSKKFHTYIPTSFSYLTGISWVVSLDILQKLNVLETPRLNAILKQVDSYSSSRTPNLRLIFGTGAYSALDIVSSLVGLVIFVLAIKISLTWGSKIALAQEHN